VLCDDVRRHCAAVASSARSVRIDLEALERLDGAPQASAPGAIDGEPEDVARHLLTLDTINFGSGWFPTLRKRPGSSGYNSLAAALREHFAANGPWSNAQLRAIDTRAVATALGQAADHELMALYAQALRSLGAWLGERGVLVAIASARGSAERFAASLAEGMALYADRGFYKRAQIASANLALAGVAEWDDLDRLTIFADNLVPHVLRCEGVLVYDPRLATRIDSGRLLRSGPQEQEIRACAVQACELLAERLGVPPRVLDNWLWNRGQEPEYKARPRHRCRCVYY
jgi:hypothetical protein